ncbi:MAG: hypothetical protein AAF721_40520 [Myxococcota bacterium]
MRHASHLPSALGLLTAASLVFSGTVSAAPLEAPTTSHFPFIEHTEVLSEAGPVIYDSFFDEHGLGIDPALLCPAAEIWFHQACRDLDWIESNLAGSGQIVTIAGSNAKLTGTAHIILREQLASDTFETVAISDDPASFGIASGPTRGGYAIDAKTRQSMTSQDNEFILLSETLSVAESSDPDAPPWFWETTYWESAIYRPGESPGFCDADGCVTLYTGGYSCEQIRDATQSRVKHQCMHGGGTGGHIMVGGIALSVGVGVVAGLVIATAGAGASTPAGVAAGGIIITGGAAAAVAVADSFCSNKAVQEAFQQQIDNGCVDVDDPTAPDPDIPVDPDLDDGDAVADAGCNNCDEWAVQVGELSEWYPDTGTLVVTRSDEEVVCLSWSLDPTGTDMNGDGWCD